jgi:hypothetical protein
MSSPSREAQSHTASSSPPPDLYLEPFVGNQLEWKEYLKANENVECPYRKYLVMPEHVVSDLGGDMPFTTGLFDQQGSQDRKLLRMIVEFIFR